MWDKIEISNLRSYKLGLERQILCLNKTKLAGMDNFLYLAL